LTSFFGEGLNENPQFVQKPESGFTGFPQFLQILSIIDQPDSYYKN
jgi:hypothetical protein